MINLNLPEKDLALRILSEVEFEDRVIGYRFHQRLGFMPVTLYSFDEIVGFLNFPMPVIELELLAKWMEEIIKDKELAARIKEIDQKDISDQEKSISLRDLMQTRLDQCRTVMSG